MEHLRDGELVERAQRGDVGAFGCLVARYERRVLGIAYDMLGDVEEARDVGQEVFLRAYARLGQVREGELFGAWLRQVAVNECRAWSKARPRITELTDDHPAADAMPGVDTRMQVGYALSGLDEVSRLTVSLFYLHGASMREIAEFLGEPVTTIKSRLRNAREKLRGILEEPMEPVVELPDAFVERVTKLIAAVQAGDRRTTEILLRADPRLVGAGEGDSRHTPLHVAAGSGHAALVELLLAHGADPNALDNGDNASPLHYAAERGWLEAAKLLVEAGADVNWDYTIHQMSPLGWAVLFDDMQREMAEYLLSQGAKFDLFSAIALGRSDIVRELAAEDPNVMRRHMSCCERYRSAIEFATERHQWELAGQLIELGAEVGVAEAAGLGRIEMLLARLAEQPAPFLVSSALKAAVVADQVDAARVLLKAGADPNFAPQGTSLLFDSIRRNDEPMSRLLLEAGADLEFKDPWHHSTPLGWQVFFGRSAPTRLALKLGAVCGDNLVALAEAGERGELRRWSHAAPHEFRATAAVLRDHRRSRKRRLKGSFESV